MTEQTVYSFPGYDHNLLEGENVRFLLGIYRRAMRTVPEIHIHDAPLPEIWRYMRNEISRINTLLVWFEVLKRLGGIEHTRASVEIMYRNEPHVYEIARSTVAGMFVGYDLVQPVFAKHQLNPIRQATLVSIEGFRTPVADRKEIAHRMALVLGTVEEPGTFGTALGNLEEEILINQPMCVDMLRVYASDFIERHFS